MTLHKEKKITMYFGDAQSCSVSHKSDAFKDYCLELSKTYDLDQLVFQRQVHGVQGMYIGRFPNQVRGDNVCSLCHTGLDPVSSPNKISISLFQTEGDFLITDKKKIGIGVLTADCLPVVLYDQKNAIIAVVHAGWRGSVENIVAKTIETMLSKHYFAPQDLLVYFGPSAKACCYEIQSDLLEQHKGNRLLQQAVLQRSDKIFLDVPALNRAQLIDLGVPPCNITTSYNICTMCNKNFHSYRRDGELSMRQPTIAWVD